MAAHNDTGNWGEAKAAAFLLEKGFEIVEKNFRNRHQEIDLIVRKDKMLVFVEVKRGVMKAAENYIFDNDWHFDVRFDIISILIFTNGKTEIRHIEDAFSK
jgi:putative endonuclease